MTHIPDARAAIREITLSLATGARVVEPPEVDGALNAYRDQVLTEAAELIRQHRGDLDDDLPWFDTRDRDAAANLLLGTRTTTTPQEQETAR